MSHSDVNGALTQMAADGSGCINVGRLLEEFEAHRDAIPFPAPPYDDLATIARFDFNAVSQVEWEQGWQAVYAFALRPEYEGCRDQGRVLKVGLARNPTRLHSHRYESQSSSLATAVETNPVLWAYLGVPPLMAGYRGSDWLIEATYGVAWLVQDVEFEARMMSEPDMAANSAVVHLERYMRARLGPVYEGTAGSGLTGSDLLAALGLLDD